MMARNVSRSSRLITLALAVLFTAPPLHAASPEEPAPVSAQAQDQQAARLLSAAKALRAEGKNEEALQRLQSVLNLTGSPALLRPIAELCLSVGERQRGLDALAEYRRQVPLARSEEVDALEQKLRALPLATTPPPPPRPPPPPPPPRTPPIVTPFPETPRRKPGLRPLSISTIVVAAGLVVVAASVGGRAVYGQRALDEQCQPTEAGSLCLAMGNQQVNELQARTVQEQRWSAAGWSLMGIATGGAILSAVTVALDLRNRRERTRVLPPSAPDSQSQLSLVR
jgi:hypothetical protein